MEIVSLERKLETAREEARQVHNAMQQASNEVGGGVDGRLSLSALCASRS